MVRPLSGSFSSCYLFGFFKCIRIQTDNFQETFCRNLLQGLSQIRFAFAFPTLVSLLSMGIREAVDFFCMVRGCSKRRFLFVDMVPEVAGVSSILAFHFGVVPLMIFLDMFSNGPFAIPSSCWCWSSSSWGRTQTNMFGQSVSLSSEWFDHLDGCGIGNLRIFHNEMLFGYQLSHFVE